MGSTQLRLYGSNKRLLPIHQSLYMEAFGYYSAKEDRRIINGVQLIRMEPEIKNGEISLDIDGNVKLHQSKFPIVISL